MPDSRPLEDGDIINIDITVFKNGFHGDCSETYLVGFFSFLEREGRQQHPNVFPVADDVTKTNGLHRFMETYFLVYTVHFMYRLALQLN